MDLGLKDKVALVTGAGSQKGFGKATALTLAKEGCDVIVVDIDLEGANKTAAPISRPFSASRSGAKSCRASRSTVRFRGSRSASAALAAIDRWGAGGRTDSPSRRRAGLRRLVSRRRLGSGTDTVSRRRSGRPNGHHDSPARTAHAPAPANRTFAVRPAISASRPATGGHRPGERGAPYVALPGERIARLGNRPA